MTLIQKITRGASYGLALAALAGMVLQPVKAQVLLTVGSAYTQDFDSLGTTQVASLPTNWKADKNTTVRLVGSYGSAVTATEQFAGNSMSSSAQNGIYNLGAGVVNEATDRAVGFISSGSATKSGNLYVWLQNNSDHPINSLTISYDVEKYRMGSNPAGFTIQMYYSTNGSTWTSAGNSFKTSINADVTNNGYASAPGVTVNVSKKTLDTTIPSSGSLYLAWNYSVTSLSTTSNAQCLGIDNVSILGLNYTLAGGAVKSSPTVGSTGGAYFGSNDGKLYGIDPATGAAVSGFPYDATTVAGTGATILSRPSVYDLNGSPTILFTSNNGYLFGLNTDGSEAFAPVQLVTGETTVSSSPMVFNNEIWIAMKNGSKVTLFKTAANGTDAQTLDFTSDTDVKSSPSVFGPSAFIGTSGGVYRVASDLTVNNTVASVGASGSPFIANTSTTPIAFTATVDGKVYAANANNGTVLTSFGTSGVVDLGITVASGDKINGSLFAYNGKLYIPGMDNKVYCLNISNGSGGGSGGSVVFFDAGSTGAAAAGVAVDPSGSGSVVFGSTDGRFYQVRLCDPTVYKMTDLGSAINTTPTVDRTNGLVLVGTDSGKVFILPSF